MVRRLTTQPNTDEVPNPDSTAPLKPDPHKDGCTAGNRAQWSGSLSAHHGGSILGQAIRGLVSGTSNAAMKFFLEQLDLGGSNGE